MLVRDLHRMIVADRGTDLDARLKRRTFADDHRADAKAHRRAAGRETGEQEQRRAHVQATRSASVANTRPRSRSARVLARATAAARLVALTEVAVLREAFFDQIVDRRVKGIQTAQLLAF